MLAKHSEEKGRKVIRCPRGLYECMIHWIGRSEARGCHTYTPQKVEYPRLSNKESSGELLQRFWKAQGTSQGRREAGQPDRLRKQRQIAFLGAIHALRDTLGIRFPHNIARCQLSVTSAFVNRHVPPFRFLQVPPTVWQIRNAPS